MTRAAPERHAQNQNHSTNKWRDREVDVLYKICTSDEQASAKSPVQVKPYPLL